jgi:hypothetical protein
MRHPPPFGARWRARWIWFEPPPIGIETATRPVRATAGDRVGLFRRRIDLPRPPGSTPCRIWSDGRHVLRVNGEEVVRGPVRSDPRRPHYDVVDLGPHLRAGPNVLAVTARHFGSATSWWSPAPPTYTLGAGSLVVEAVIDGAWIVSDGSWRCRPGEAWTPVAVPGDVACLPMESFDAGAHPRGWESVAFDDGDWPAAIELQPVHVGTSGDPHPPSEPFGLLRPPVRQDAGAGPPVVNRATPTARGLRSGAEALADPVDQVLADEQRPGDGGEETIEHHTFDVGHVAAGTVELEVRGAAAGTVIDIAGAEHLDHAGRLAPLGQHAGLRYRCGGGDRERFESLDVLGARHLHASVRAPGGGPGPDLGLALNERLRPRPPGASFACSDPDLERIFAVGLRTVDLCAHDAYVDCPTREQRAWTGDSVVHQMVDLVTNPDWSLARRHPRLAATTRSDGMPPMAVACDFAADDRTIIPDWSLHWVRSVHNLWRYTGDRELVDDLLPVVERALRWFEAYLGDDGLLDGVTGWVLLDWASVYASGCSSTLNALWARGLEDLADLADGAGNAGTAAWARDRREGVRAAFDRFWDEGRGVYVDHVVDGDVRRVAAQHPGAAALAAGLVPDDRRARVVSALTDRARLIRHSWVMDTVTVDGGSTGHTYLATGYPEPEWDVEAEMVEAEPFFRYVLHDGLARAGRADLVAGLCRDWTVFLEAGETTWPECWTGGTRCHGWSATPTRDLIVHTLGITPGAPGYSTVRVAPALGDLDWARATVPTPHGPVTVEARADGTVEIDSPVPVVGA